ncbi:MAG: ATP-binding cassette domain-containing protein, partial [Thermodesulfobacteriota bacterium]
MIEVKDLKKSFNGQEVLRGVNLTINKGETTTIIGRSGGGKSVLLKHLIGVLRPDSGNIIVDGEDITKMSKRELKRMKRKFGMVFQFAALFDSMTV